MLSLVCALILAAAAPAQEATSRPAHTFAIGAEDFLLDGQPFVIRSGEMHAARVPPEYWEHRLQMVRAMGCNTVCAYLFWNQHEPQPGQFEFQGAADVARYCHLAQAAGLWVILRPGPYACAEWDLGGLPWWLLKTPDIQLRTRDARYLDAVRRYLLRVGQELAPLQITRGGPILMVQVENEYGSYGKDRDYIGAVRDQLRGAGFDVPLFTCDGPSQLKNDTRDDLFCVVNFGGNPAGAFAELRKVRPTGPLMCGEFYPGWFDSWGRPHHRGNTEHVVRDLGAMLAARQSFSIYMVHGGTSFGFSAGANAPPFAPQSTSYDYDAPIDEAGRPTARFFALRTLFGKHLLPGETLPPVPAEPTIVSPPTLKLSDGVRLWAVLGEPRRSEPPLTFEAMDLAQGYALYRTDLPAGPAAVLRVVEPHDLVQVWLDRERVGVIDRRSGRNSLPLPARDRGQKLSLLVEAFGRVNYGGQLHDRKGITERVELVAGDSVRTLGGFEIFPLACAPAWLDGLPWRPTRSPFGEPALYRGQFVVSKPGDTFLDLRKGEGAAEWVNGHALGRYWNIGPQQTLYLPGCWLKPGYNQLVVLDIDGGLAALELEGLGAPILDQVGLDPLAPRPLRRAGQTLDLSGLVPVGGADVGDQTGKGWNQCRVSMTGSQPVRHVAVQFQSSQPGDPFTTCAELRLLDEREQEIPRNELRVVYADSEELQGENGAAGNVLDDDPATFWHTEWQARKPAHPHVLVLELSKPRRIAGVRWLDRQDSRNGRIRALAVFVSETPFRGL